MAAAQVYMNTLKLAVKYRMTAATASTRKMMFNTFLILSMSMFPPLHYAFQGVYNFVRIGNNASQTAKVLHFHFTIHS